ncbi:SymE family type I addiction module toxin [Lachnospiraceae bacterium 46-15]
MLKGNWLRDLGFDIGDYISISCEDGKLVITPDAERAELAKAEAEFMERETKALQKKFQKEKERLHLQFVAEREAEYGVAEGV